MEKISTKLKHFINKTSQFHIGSHLSMPGWMSYQIYLKHPKIFTTLDGCYGPELCLSLLADSTKENGEYKSVTLYRRDIYYSEPVKFYHMEYKDGKEYEGYCKLPNLQYECHKGIINGSRNGNKFSIPQMLEDREIIPPLIDGKLEGPYTEFFDKIDGKKKVEGFYKEGKKEGVWKYYTKNGDVLKKEYWHKGKNCTEKYEILKKVASKRIEEENKLSEGKNERVVLPKMTAEEKRDAIKEAKKDLSR